MESIRRIYWPAINLIGPGAVKEIGVEIKKLNLKKLLLVTDKVLRKIGVVDSVTAVLTEAKIDYVIFDEVEPNPTCKNVNDGLNVFKQNNCDSLLSVGGGSPQDAAKAIGILYTNGGNIVNYEGIGKSTHKSVPIVAVNTTAGTASEVTVNYVITDEVRKIKMVMVDPNCLAAVAVNDPELMVKMPAGLTAATGMDALTHAIESYICKGSFRLAETLSLEAIKLIGESLEIAVCDGENMEARSKMAWGSYVAGLSFSNSGLGIVHSMAHQLGAEYNLPHGVANSILLPYVEEFNSVVCVEKFAKIAEALGIDTTRMSDEEARRESILALADMAERLNIPKLADTPFRLQDIHKLATQAMIDVCTGGNPREVTLDDIKTIYRNAYHQMLLAKKTPAEFCVAR
ncbi:iron-containing alcohol dehydrogenase [Mucilaginibacter paludis]|uniref:Iron-containing alcohol dehydrogenase n=1 Tax=Mucilaginibacter paludis DSM 18603 TaxID=714943 RepID=H1YGF1_9SPHI|nr:iron-containing alcohol dehydrogenase [Mucilaginibacter paludis]EHQ24503.1 iron-containing alcohol dehydrogenase [Mucilaginibacter paludis DSM 18603]